MQMQMHAEGTMHPTHLTTWNLQPCFWEWPEWEWLGSNQEPDLSLTLAPLGYQQRRIPGASPARDPRQIARKLHSDSPAAQPPLHANDGQVNVIIIATCSVSAATHALQFAYRAI